MRRCRSPVEGGRASVRFSVSPFAALAVSLTALACGAPGAQEPEASEAPSPAPSRVPSEGGSEPRPGAGSDAGTSDRAVGCGGTPTLDGAADFRSELRGLDEIFDARGGYVAFLRTDAGLSSWRLDERLAEIAPPSDVLAYDRALGASLVGSRVVRDGTAGFVAAGVYRGRGGETLVVRDLGAEAEALGEVRAHVTSSLDRYDDAVALAVAPSGDRFVAVTDLPLVGRYARGAASLELAETAACPPPSFLATGGEVLGAAWTGETFQGICGASLATFRSGVVDSSRALAAVALAPNDCVATSKLVWEGDGFAQVAWTYEGKASAQGGVVCGDGFTVPAYGALPEGARVSLKVSRLHGHGFGPWKTLHSYARPAGFVWRADALRDGAGYLVVSERAATEWQLRSVDLEGRDRASPLALPVDGRAFGARLRLLRGGVLVSWAMGDASTGGGGAQRIACR